jgi:hypothetical protein
VAVQLNATVVAARTVCVVPSDNTKTVPLRTQSPVSADPVDPPSATSVPVALPTWTSTMLESGAFQLVAVWPVVAPESTGIGLGLAVISCNRVTVPPWQNAGKASPAGFAPRQFTNWTPDELARVEGETVS